MVWACSQSANGGGFYTITVREEVCSLLLLLLNTHYSFPLLSWLGLWKRKANTFSVLSIGLLKMYGLLLLYSSCNFLISYSIWVI